MRGCVKVVELVQANNAMVTQDCVRVCARTRVCGMCVCTFTSLRRPKRTSVFSDRSWASSMMMALYWSRSGSLRDSRSRMPSVMYLMIVD